MGFIIYCIIVFYTSELWCFNPPLVVVTKRTIFDTTTWKTANFYNTDIKGYNIKHFFSVFTFGKGTRYRLGNHKQTVDQLQGIYSQPEDINIGKKYRI